MARRRVGGAGAGAEAGAGANGAGPAGDAPVKRVVRRRAPTSSSDRGKVRTEAQKAKAMKEIKAKAAAPRIAQLSAAVADACSRDEYKDAQARGKRGAGGRGRLHDALSLCEL